MSLYSDDHFVLNDISSHSCEFFWEFNILNFSLIEELKIGSCKVNWKLQCEYIDDYPRLEYEIGFQGENLGAHSGILTLNSTVNRQSIELSKNDAHMRYSKFFLKDTPDETCYLSGTITILYCDCFKKPNKERLINENVIELKNDIHILLKNKQFTDIDIKVDETCFPVHKFILRARSPVFAKMLDHDMKENQDNCITVSDTSEKIMESFISFLYSGSLGDDSFDTVIGLYSLADEYEVTSLLKTCRIRLISSISQNTVLEILKISDLHTDEELKEKATQFICDQFSQIEPSPEWSSLLDSNTRLASYVVRYVSVKCAKK